MKRVLTWTFPGFVFGAVFAGSVFGYTCPNGNSYVTTCTAVNQPCIRTVSGAGCCLPGTCSSSLACVLPGGNPPNACNDNNICTNDLCATVNGSDPLTQWNPMCTYTNADGTMCEADGTKCTSDVCQNGTCVQGAPKVCTTTQCRVPACDPLTGNCVSSPVPNPAMQACDDGNDCTAGEVCYDGLCQNGAPQSGAVCANGQQCHTGICSGTTCPSASRSNNAAGTPCDRDADPCTLDACNGSGSCTATGNTLNCEDGKYCSEDACATGVGCVRTYRQANLTCYEGLWCNPGHCNGVDADCHDRALKPLGAQCDTNACTDATCQLVNGVETCVINGCVAGATCNNGCGVGAACGDNSTATDPTMPCLCTTQPH